MNFELLKRLSKNVVDEQSLFSWLQFYSVQTWNKLEFVRSRKNLKLTETTVTQNLVFDFWQLAMATRLPVEIYESNAEKLNGNDLEVFVETPKGYISMPCQAKLVQKNNKYSTISHKRRSNSSLQINLLIEYAKKNKGIPIYFLYNYCSNKKHCKEVEELSGTEIENYGITVINANCRFQTMLTHRSDLC